MIEYGVLGKLLVDCDWCLDNESVSKGGGC